MEVPPHGPVAPLRPSGLARRRGGADAEQEVDFRVGRHRGGLPAGRPRVPRARVAPPEHRLRALDGRQPPVVAQDGPRLRVRPSLDHVVGRRQRAGPGQGGAEVGEQRPRRHRIGYTDVDSSGRGAGDGRAVYEGPQAPEAFHRRVQEADSRPPQRRKAQARDHGRARPRQEHRGEVDQVDKRDRLAARRGQPHGRAGPDPGARAREPQAPDGDRRLKTSGADMRSEVKAMAANEGRYPISAQRRLLGVASSTCCSMRSRPDRPAAPAVVAAHATSKGRYGSRKVKASL